MLPFSSFLLSTWLSYYYYYFSSKKWLHVVFQPLMKELDEMEKMNAKLSAAVEEVTLEHCKKNEVIIIHFFPILSIDAWRTSFWILGGLVYICSFSMPLNIGYDIQIVKHHSQEVGLQRRVFVDFFCNPERLRSQVRELTARVRALQV